MSHGKLGSKFYVAKAGRVKILWKLKYGGQNSIFFSWNPWSKFYVPWKGGSKFYIFPSALKKGGQNRGAYQPTSLKGCPPPGTLPSPSDSHRITVAARRIAMDVSLLENWNRKLEIVSYDKAREDKTTKKTVMIDFKNQLLISIIQLMDIQLCIHNDLELWISMIQIRASMIES